MEVLKLESLCCLRVASEFFSPYRPRKVSELSCPMGYGDEGLIKEKVLKLLLKHQGFLGFILVNPWNSELLSAGFQSVFDERDHQMASFLPILLQKSGLEGIVRDYLSISLHEKLSKCESPDEKLSVLITIFMDCWNEISNHPFDFWPDRRLMKFLKHFVHMVSPPEPEESEEERLVRKYFLREPFLPFPTNLMRKKYSLPSIMESGRIRHGSATGQRHSAGPLVMRVWQAVHNKKRSSQ